MWKRRTRCVRWGSGRRCAIPVVGIAADVSLLNKVASKPGCSRSARDESGGCPLFWPGGVRHVGDVSPVCGFCTERGKARLDTAVRDRVDREREWPNRLCRVGGG